MKKYFLFVLVGIGYLLLFSSFLTFFPWVSYPTTCQSVHSYLNPLGIEKDKTMEWGRFCGMMRTNGSLPIHFLLTDLTIIWCLIMFVYLFLNKKFFLIKRFLLFFLILLCLIFIINYIIEFFKSPISWWLHG